MVRRALLDRGDELTADTEALPDNQPTSDGDPRSAPPEQTPAHWRGAGGRWLVWMGRAVVWAVIVLVGYRGVLAIVSGPGSGDRAPVAPRVRASPGFPAAAAEAYALEFGDVYLNFSPATAAARSKALATFLPPGADSQFGWNGKGTQRLLDEQVAGITVSGQHAAVVTLLARLADGRLIELGVPVYTGAGGMSVSGDPALLPGPAKAVAPAVGQPADQSTEAALQSQLAAFFAAYASGDQATLARFVVPGAHVTGLRGVVSFGGIDSVYAPAGGSTRTVSVTVTWRFPAQSSGRRAAARSAALQMTYEMTVVQRSGTWDVESIGASTQALAQGPP